METSLQPKSSFGLALKILGLLIVLVAAFVVIQFYLDEAAEHDSLTPELAASKVIGTLLVFGSTIKEIPQLAKILQAGSVEGLARSSFYLDFLMQLHLSAYCLRHQVPFNVFGEALSLLVIDTLYILLYWRYEFTKSSEKLFVSIFFLLYAALLFEGSISIIGGEEFTWALILDATTFLNIFAKVPQLYANFVLKSTGMLSIVTLWISAIGRSGRVFTAVIER